MAVPVEQVLVEKALELRFGVETGSSVACPKSQDQRLKVCTYVRPQQDLGNSIGFLLRGQSCVPDPIGQDQRRIRGKTLKGGKVNLSLGGAFCNICSWKMEGTYRARSSC